MTNFDFESEKKKKIAELDALEQLSIKYKKLTQSLSELDVVALIESHIQKEVDKLNQFANKNNIVFNIDTSTLIASVKIPSVPTVENKNILPFIPEEGQSLKDVNGDTWEYYNRCWEKCTDQDWISSDCWESSAC